MQSEHEIIHAVYSAKTNSRKADALIRAYIPFIKKEAAKSTGGLCTEADDEYSIAMIAFHEAIMGYERARGSFLGYASTLIRSRLIDFARREKRHRGHLSLDLPAGEDADDGRTLGDTLAQEGDFAEESARLDATKAEIAELSAVMEGFGVSFTDAADNAPKQERTLAACAKAIAYAATDKALLDILLETKKLPLAQLTDGAGVDRKTLERHRKYILVMLLIQTNGYEIIRGHISRILKGKGALTV